MASKLIVIRQRLAAALGAAFAAFTGELSPVLDERVGPFLDDDDAGFDFDALQRALARMVEASRDRLVAADKVHLDELAGDGAARDERDRRVDPELRLSASTGAVNLDPSRWADELEPEVEGLRRAIDAVGADVQEAALTVEVKKEAMVEHDRLMSACGRILSGLCLLADRPDLARQVRVTPPRVRKAPAARKQDAGETPSLAADAPSPVPEEEAGETSALPATSFETPELPAISIAASSVGSDDREADVGQPGELGYTEVASVPGTESHGERHDIQRDRRRQDGRRLFRSRSRLAQLYRNRSYEGRSPGALAPGDP